VMSGARHLLNVDDRAVFTAHLTDWLASH
jgi:hypothetical protein